MERRDWSLEALSELRYIDSLDSEQRAQELINWNDKYLTTNEITDFDLDLDDLKILEELFFKNINFLKEHKQNTKIELDRLEKLRKFAKHK